MPRLYITGASCSGVSTLGAALSDRLGVPFLDADDFFLMPTDPPFTTKRSPEFRVSLIQDLQAQTEGWILSGSFIGWGEALIENVDLILFLYARTTIRLQRLDAREAQRHGARILLNGDMHESHVAFREWASRYDDPSFSGSSLLQHERWLAEQSVPVLRLDGELDTDGSTQKVLNALSDIQRDET